MSATYTEIVWRRATQTNPFEVNFVSFNKHKYWASTRFDRRFTFFQGITHINMEKIGNVSDKVIDSEQQRLAKRSAAANLSDSRTAE